MYPKASKSITKTNTAVSSDFIAWEVGELLPAAISISKDGN